ncbi:MAG: DUF2244 domain-containing protein [Gammaproteobacteria bacterium]|nr:DUF2244 domain-containing protein [Gammaproteobacteria bacterium]MCY4210702.1 DUF2244 domain-containing protein [Gammaproteobacteria bacterium]
MIRELKAAHDAHDHDAYDQGGRTFVVAPNRSMSWKQLSLAFAVIAGVTLIVGGYFWVRGFTLVLPFSGLELLALGAALYITAWRGGTQEVITITDAAVSVETGRSAPEQRYDFQRYWTKVVLRRPWVAWYPSKLLLCSHGREIEIGRFLNEEERKGLAQVLRSALQQRA